MENKKIIKQNKNIKPAYHGLSSAYLNLVKDYFTNNQELTNEELIVFLSQLRNFDYRTNFDKMFSFEIENGNYSGYFTYDPTQLSCQQISVNPYNNTFNLQLRKALVFTSFLHEQAHELQFDKNLYYAFNENEIEDDLDKATFLSMFCRDSLGLDHDFLTHEILAEMQSCETFFYLLKEKVIPLEKDYVMLLCRCFVNLYKNINLLHMDNIFSTIPVADSSVLIEKYKKNFKSITLDYHCFGILNDDMATVKVDKVNLDNLQKALDEKFKEFYEMFDELFELFIYKYYVPTYKFCEFAKINKISSLISKWHKTPNKILLADAIITDHLYISNNKPNRKYEYILEDQFELLNYGVIKEIEEENER